MKNYKNEQAIGQLEKRKGGYFYLKIEADIINQFEKKRHTRFICTIDNTYTFQCGLNHLGDGHFFIILSSKKLSPIGKGLADVVTFELNEDPNPLGVDMPEVLSILLEEDEYLKSKFENLTDGKIRSVIHYILKIKDIDKQIEKTIQIINDVNKPRPKKVF